MIKDKFPALSPGQCNDLDNTIASFELDGIVVTEKMIVDAVKILTGEATADALVEEFIQSLTIKKETE